MAVAITLWPRTTPARRHRNKRADHSMHGSWRLESERPPLLWPRHRRVDETLETVTTWQSSLDSGLDDVGGEEGERQRHPDRTVGLALSQSERLQSLEWIGQEFVQPAMGFANGVDEDRAGVSAHRPRARVLIALNNFALAIRRVQRPRKRQRPRVRFFLHGLRQLDLNRRAADRYPINQVANVGRRGAGQGQFANGLDDERFDMRGRNANDRSRFALLALQSRLRDIVAPALGPLLGPGRAHPVAAIVKEFSRE